MLAATRSLMALPYSTTALSICSRASRFGHGVVARRPPGLERFLQVDVQRDHPAFDVQVLDHHFLVAVAVAVADLQLAGRELADFLDQLVLEAVARERHLAVFQRVGHAPHAVVLLDQQVLALDLLAGGVLLRREVVLDQLEHVGERGQVEHQHHHALDAGGDAELVARMLAGGRGSRGRTASCPAWPGPARCRFRCAACAASASAGTARTPTGSPCPP